jgi:diguanylate cyclase (GGDEF)-like protein
VVVFMKKLVSLILSGSFALVLLRLPGTVRAFFSADYLPHRYCYLAEPALVWANVATDGLIAASYAGIFGCLLWIFLKLRSTPQLQSYMWILLSFASFIVACGATHAMEIVTIWFPYYPLSAAVKVVCAVVSIPTAVLFAKASPRLAKSAVRLITADHELQLANKDLLELSARDALTHLNNRRHFESVLVYEWQRCTRSACSIAILMMDVDHFKAVNDRYGHLAGDDCLRRIAHVFSSRKWRAEDHIARYGGEEFTLLLPGSDATAAERIGEELRQAVMDLMIENLDSPVTPVVTISVGIASSVPEYGQDAKDLLAAADAALYKAKHRGRNRVESSAIPTLPITDSSSNRSKTGDCGP